jgi:hypothetical protein
LTIPPMVKFCDFIYRQTTHFLTIPAMVFSGCARGQN